MIETAFTPDNALVGGALNCPGPALANLARGSREALVLVIAMLAGSQLLRLAGNKP